MLYVNKFRKNGELQMRGVKMTVFYGAVCLHLVVSLEEKKQPIKNFAYHSLNFTIQQTISKDTKNNNSKIKVR